MVKKRQPSSPNAYALDFSRYFPSVDQRLRYRGMELLSAVAAVPSNVRMQDVVSLHKTVQNPHKDSDLKRYEAAARRNWAVQSALMVREHFTFAKASEFQFELNPEDAKDMNDEEQQEKIKANSDWQDAIHAIQKRDKELEFVAQAKVFLWQSLIFGRGALIKIFNGKGTGGEVTKLFPINSRRLGDPIIDDKTWDCVGVMVDGQPLKMDSMIYAPYANRQISPHTEYFGYSALETVAHVAESLNIMVEEDIKEIFKSAWLASILLQIDTSGLTPEQGMNKIKKVVDSIKAGKFIGFNEAVVATPLDLKPNMTGLVEVVSKVEQIVYKALHVPQFLVQNEGIANRATAIASAQLFLDGVIASDQAWLTAVFTKQWYEPELRKQLGLSDEDDMPIRIKRIFNQAKVSEFIDLADAVIGLKNANIWDIQKANEVLGSPEVTQRVIKEQEERERKQMEMMQQSGGGRPEAEAEAAKEKARLMKGLADATARINSSKVAQGEVEG